MKHLIKDLEWSKNLVANTATHSYRIGELGGKYIVTYCKIVDGYAKEATGFTTLDQAKEWAFNHHCEKLSRWLNTDLLTDTVNWFKKAKPEPTKKDVCVQIGCHYEEVAEMMVACHGVPHMGSKVMNNCAEAYKETTEAYGLDEAHHPKDHIELLDALADQIVTAVGVAYMMGFDIIGALTEVNASNWSKFVDGKAVTDENGKIIKGEGYFKPELDRFVGGSNE